jgi:outer membrane protein TolC
MAGMRFAPILAVLLLGSSARAQVSVLTLSDCLARARERSARVIEAEQASRGARAAAREARGAFLPQLSAHGQLLRSDDASTNLPDDNNATLRLQQSLDPFSAGRAAARRARAEARAAGYSEDGAAADAALEVKTLYFSVLRDSAAVGSLDRVSASLRELLNAVLPRYTVGRAPAFDPVKVRLALADLARRRGLTVSRLDGEREALALKIGLSGGRALALAPLRAEDPPPPAADEGDLAGDPTLQALDAGAAASEAGVVAARRARRPDLVGALEYGYADYATSGMTAGWAASVGLQLPLFDGGRIAARVARADAGLGQARARAEERRRALRAEFVRATAEAAAYRADRARLAALLPEVHRAAQADIRRYRLGAIGVLEAADALNLWLDTLLQERSARCSYLIDLATLERLTGGRYAADYGG